METLNLTDLDSEELEAYIQNNMKDHEIWRPYLSAAVEFCLDNTLRRSNVFQTIYNFTKVECDVTYIYFIVCFHEFSSFVSFVERLLK